MSKTETLSKGRLAAIMVVYLLGVFMGSVDTGIITPARTVIQSSFGIDANTGIWMITVYTLAYAASIPVMGKLADRHGRKVVFLACIFVFGLGSLFCGLSEYADNYAVLLVSRAIQAIGGGGIVPIANAEFGTTFPPEKRGMALGMVGGIYGIANVVGSSFGSAILDLFGQANWAFIFYFNVPIAVVILVLGLKCLPNNTATSTKKTDYVGSLLFVVIILLLMYGLRNLDFFDFVASATSTQVWPFMLAAVVLWPLFVFVEHRAEDPIFNLSYFKNLNICLVMIMGVVTGVIMMGMIFVPQFSENVLRMESGSGGYFVLIIGLVSGMGAPMSGVIIDKAGVKPVIGLGFLVSALGGLFLAFVTAANPNMLTIVVGLVVAGIGLGFVMGTPLNYMMLENTDEHEANSALATLSLVRSFGTIIAPAIMVGFISHAGMTFQDKVMDYMPDTIDYSTNQYVQDLREQMEPYQDMMDLDEMMGDGMSLDGPVSIDGMGDGEDGDMDIPDDVLARMEASDVTTVTENCVYMADVIFDDMQDEQIANVEEQLDEAASEVPPMMAPMLEPVFEDLKDHLPDIFATAKEGYLQDVRDAGPAIEQEFQETLNVGFKQVYLAVAVSSAIGLLLLAPYKGKRHKKKHAAA